MFVSEDNMLHAKVHITVWIWRVISVLCEVVLANELCANNVCTHLSLCIIDLSELFTFRGQYVMKKLLLLNTLQTLPEFLIL